jgi:hypothetical protein
MCGETSLPSLEVTLNDFQAILSWYHNHNSKVLKADNGELEQVLLNIAGKEPKLPRTK